MVEVIDGEEAPGGQPPDNSGDAKGREAGKGLVTQDAQGRITGRAKLTEKQERFAEALAHGMPPTRAAQAAGYSGYRGDATRARQSPAVQARVKEILQRRMARGASLAIKVVEDILTGKIEAPASVRLDAAKHVQRVAGIDGGAERDKQNKDLRTMTMEELQALAAAFREKAQVRTVPTGTGDDAQVIDVDIESTT